MTTYLCRTCGTHYPPATAPPERCPICDDARQYVPHDVGQVWLTRDELLAGHEADVRDDHGILGIGCRPDFAIGQRALLVEEEAGNVLWECTPYLDDALVERLEALGGVAAIAISHPHYYTAMVEWAHAFDCPIHIHEAERKWVLRPDDHVSFWSGETKDLGGGVTLVRTGGHFTGAQVLHWQRRRALLTGDILNVVPDRRYVSFMYSYPNQIPLPPHAVRRIAAALEPFEFDSIYGAWWDRTIERDGSDVVRRSADRYVRAVTDGLHS
jgi:glyoxylase-like metal-dependent hydrolase (beta-lactamase superfamily II)